MSDDDKKLWFDFAIVAAILVALARVMSVFGGG